MLPSPEPPDKLVPRLCHMVKGEHGYGFNLHSDKTKQGQFVRVVDHGSAADSADIRPGDRLVEVQPKGNTHKPTHTNKAELSAKYCRQSKSGNFPG